VSPARPSEQNPFAALRGLVRTRPPAERCDLCGTGLPADHPHLIESASRRLVCSCGACAILLSGRPDAPYRRVPRRVQHLPDLRLTDAQWEGLHVPINLAFFVPTTAADRVVALYPSPAGATESFLTPEAWRELADSNPVLGELEPEVEALLVNRVGETREYYRVPIDECYKLVGLVRTHWRGLAGGAAVWDEIGRFFAGLKRRSGPGGEVAHG
jgi:hypothetical protein